MGWEIAIAAIGAIIGGVSASNSATASRKATTARRNQGKAQQNTQDLEIRKARIEARARRRAATAQILAGGEAAGAAGSSSVAGGVGAAISQESSQQSFLTGMQVNQNAFLAAQGAEAKANQTANMWQSVGAISSAVGKQYGSFTKPNKPTSMATGGTDYGE